MSGRDKQLDDEENEITAQPKSMPEELGMLVGHEQGLSVDPDDLGRAFLSDATEQGNFESARGGENDDLWASSSSSSDEALSGPNFDVDKDVWENTVNLTLQNGAGSISDPLIEDEDSDNDDGLHAIEDRDSGDIDLTQSSVQEASLFDHEADELGETEEPHVLITEDAHTHAKHPGVHAAPSRPMSARAPEGALGPARAASDKPSARPKAAAAKPAAKSVAPKATKKAIPPAKKATPAKASKPKVARSSAPRAR
ncbi:MAG: hypothetical protein RLZZ450_7040 [Pseudomonadota bacterium]|jgi:hypothetical protein